jgi:hypothetical protein
MGGNDAQEQGCAFLDAFHQITDAERKNKQQTRERFHAGDNHKVPRRSLSENRSGNQKSARERLFFI